MAPDSPATDSAGPDSNLRGIVSLVVIIHLFMVAVALSANLSVSELQDQLLSKLSVYLQPLNLKLSDPFSHKLYHHSVGDPSQDDHFLEIEFQGGDRDGEVIRLPDDQWRGSPTRNRYQALTHMLGYYAHNDADEMLSPFAQSIGAHFLGQDTTSEAIVRVRRHAPMPLNAAVGSQQRPLDPNAEVYFQTLYQARVWVDTKGQANLVKLDASGQVAPLRNDEESGNE